MMKLLLLLTLTSAACLVTAEQITLPIGQQTRQSDANLPQRGVDKDTVRKRFGDPQEVTSAVGEPHISRWIYPDYVVYFDKNWVLHTVVKHPSQ